ncbi:MAG: glycosyltransferase family 4 protein [Acidobacteriota bacterium]|nr:glycosyltransferase family 4 protein [Acidobacteriota bacterium]
MRVLLYHPFSDPWRQSMRVYASELGRALRSVSGAGAEIRDVTLPHARLDPPLRYWDQYVRYPRLARRSSGDVHHILDHGFSNLAGALPSRRIVVTFHDAIPLRSGRASFGTRRTLGYGMRAAAAKGARFITGSEASRKDAETFFAIDPAAISIVPYGVNEAFRPAADRQAVRARLAIRRRVALIVGHTQPYMNVEGALRAAAVSARHVDLEVVKIGVPLTVAQGALAETEGLGGRIRERGIVSDAELRDWYAAADVLLYLPKLSGYGLPVLEAMASGTPVVTSSVGAVPEIAAGAAVLVDPLDAESAGEALAALLGDEPRRAALVRDGLARAAEYPWSRAAEETMRVYRMVADGA